LLISAIIYEFEQTRNENERNNRGKSSHFADGKASRWMKKASKLRFWAANQQEYEFFLCNTFVL